MELTLSRRMQVRFAEEDMTWIAEQAADEGVDDATFVRMLVNRLRRGRPPLMRMMLEVQPAKRAVAVPTLPAAADLPPDVDAEAVLAERLAESGLEPNAPPIEHEPEPEAQVVAMSMRRVPRQSYNPGRGG